MEHPPHRGPEKARKSPNAWPLRRFDCACAPALSDGLGREVRKDLVFAVFQPIENPHCRGLRRGFRYESCFTLCPESQGVISNTDPPCICWIKKFLAAVP